MQGALQGWQVLQLANMQTISSHSPCARHKAAPVKQVGAALRHAGVLPVMERVTNTPLNGQQSLQLSDVPPQATIHLLHHTLSHERQAPAGSIRL